MTDAVQSLGNTNDRSQSLARDGWGFATSTETGSSSMNSPYTTRNAAISPPLPLQPTKAVRAEAEAHFSREPPSETAAEIMGSTSLRPSPKAYEEVQPPEDNASIQRGKISTLQLQERPAQLTSTIPRTSRENMSYAPITSYGGATTPAANQFTVPSSANETQRGMYAHPPGYIQNPYALEATVEQRLAAGLESDDDEELLPMPNLTRTRRLSAASIMVEGGLVGLLKKARRNTIDLIEGVREWTGDTF